MFDSTIEAVEALNETFEDSLNEQGYMWLCGACENQPTFESIYELFSHKRNHSKKKKENSVVDNVTNCFMLLQDLNFVNNNNNNNNNGNKDVQNVQNVQLNIDDPALEEDCDVFASNFSTSSTSSEDIPLASLKICNLKATNDSIKKFKTKQKQRKCVNNNNSKTNQNKKRFQQFVHEKGKDVDKAHETKNSKEEKENHKILVDNDSRICAENINSDYNCQKAVSKEGNNKPKTKHICKICNTEFSSRIDLSTHKKTHLFQDTGCFKCETCGKMCPKYDNFTRHLTIHYTDRKKSHQCSQCFASFYNLADLKRHLVLHLDVKPFRCEHCGEGFIRQDNLLIHAYKHTGIQYKKFACKDCDKVLNSPSALVMHAKTHSVKTVFCPESGCVFSCYLQSQLRQHMRKHSGEKPFQCAKCGRCFARSNDMKNHVLNVHEGIRPFKCSSCPKEFALIGNLRIHKITHTNERPYLCAQCGKCFNQASTLRKHSILMHNPWRTSGEFKQNKKQFYRDVAKVPCKVACNNKKNNGIQKDSLTVKIEKNHNKSKGDSEKLHVQTSCKVNNMGLGEQFTGFVIYNRHP